MTAERRNISRGSAELFKFVIPVATMDGFGLVKESVPSIDTILPRHRSADSVASS